ncbi:hypothetical protein OGAPHI_001190 [Ogataea philodendri]|uniref:amidase n=1 Tax=Ogataea philodendri TaxID=1378263 RepID=A0A9P8PFM7_9ASCO|nr:uncharacterized protein OGAPHI_001190 [Ogataea philodendri]KAH3670675.1 hypothetical protein OGAPHI_001190 [Ogataea philodendri]
MNLTLYGPYTNDTENPALFETFKPKIEAYNKKLADNILDEYKLPEDLIPTELGLDVTPIAKKFLSKEEFAITETTATKLASEIASGKLTAVEVFKAFAKRATACHQLVNCAMELFIDEGLERAKELDEYYQKTGKTVGPLHGLPISIKEHYAYKDKVTHAGYVGLIENVTTEWSHSAKLLLDAGAVFYIRTTEPQSLMHLCSRNNITGVCRNPFNTNLTSGGSSSGEGAITAFKGSAFGLGSDGGGSIRAPAAFCGVWGIRCTGGRSPLLGMMTAHSSGQNDGFPVVAGPLANSPEDLELGLKVLLNQPWKDDSSLLPMPWKDVPLPKVSDLTIAICYDDGVVKPTPPMIRGLKYAAKQLEAAGAKVIEWDALNVLEVVQAVHHVYNADKNAAQKKELAASGEPIVPLTYNCLEFGCGDNGISLVDSWKIAQFRDEQRNLYLKTMNDKGVDFILMPTYCNVAPKPDTCHYWGYTCMWNFLDFPGVIFPSGLRADPAVDVPDFSEPRSEIEKYEHDLYNTAPEDFKGAPICLQLIGRRWFCEDTLKAAEAISGVL